MGPFLHKSILKIIYYDCVGIRTTVIQAGSIIIYSYILFLFLKNLKTFSWAPKTVVGPQHRLTDKSALLSALTALGVASLNKPQCLSSRSLHSSEKQTINRSTFSLRGGFKC